MKMKILGIMLFGSGAALMCFSGSKINLTWLESAFILGAILVTGAGMYLSRMLSCEEQ